jgi:hypothetical protein
LLLNPVNPYNGYSPKKREKKLRASYKVFPNRTHPLYHGPCQLCGDPDAPVEPHTEDYSEPFLWDNPAEYAVCRTCHSRLHKRFSSPHAWLAYKMHIRRGGYGSDLKTEALATQVKKLAEALEAGVPFPLPPLPRDKVLTGTEWWEQLSVDPRMLTDPAARPRP